ncbi:MAG: rRNA maturation RNase YbeY [Chloroflexi bacterium]|nr:rRNA maturation RNase YbeY [Chloroflexota bacterium]
MSDDYTIYVTVEGDYHIDQDAVWWAAWYALQAGGAEAPIAIGVTVTTDEQIRDLNHDYAGIDEVTDVLSFPADAEPYNVEPDEPPYFGDVIIAYPTAERQASERGHTVHNELQMLTIHGALHLLGYDHDSPDNKAIMWALESSAMDALRENGQA